MAADTVDNDLARRSANLRRVSHALGLAIFMLGFLVMVGWIFNIPLFMRLHPALPSMKFNTAILFFLSGLGLLSLPANTRYKKLLPLPILLIASLTLSQYLFGWNLGIDQFFMVDTQTLVASPGRMSFTTTISFICFAIGLNQLDQRPRITQLCAILIAIPSMIVLAGYAYNVPDLYRIFIFSTIALHTALAFLSLATALILADTKSRLIQIILSDSAGAKLIRQALPLSLLFLLAIDFLFIFGEQNGFYPIELVWPLNIIASLAAVIVVITLIARDWHETDMRRIVAEEQLKIYNESLEELVQERTKALQSSQMRFAGVLDSAHDAIISIDAQERIILFNQGAEAIFGYTTAELIGKPMNILIPERFRNGHSRYIEAFANAKASSRVMASSRPELTGLHKDGHEFFIEASISRLELDNELIYTVFIRDISRQKAAEEEINTYKVAIEASSDLIVVVDSNYRYILANDAHLHYNQRERHEVIYHQVSEILGEEVFKNLKAYYDRCFAGEAVTFEQPIHFARYGLRHLLVNYSPLRNPANEVVAVVVIAHDITERKVLENILIESEEKLKTLFEVLPVGVSLLNKAGQLVQANRMLEKILGLSLAEILQGNNRNRQFIHSDGSPMLPDEFASTQAIRNQSPIFDVETGAVKDSGEIIWMSVSAAPLGHSDLSAVVVTLDISQRKNAEMQLRQLDSERQRVKILHDFIQSASHDLKTPITQIITTVYLLQKSSKDEQQLLRLRKLESYTKHLSNIVQALLQMSELDTKEVFAFSRMDINEILRDVLASYIAKAQQKRQEFVITPANTPLYINVDGKYFYMALHSILQNALDYTPEGGTIHVSSYQKGAENVIEIADSGIGIDEADLVHIFERFYRADKSRSIGEGHTGMGLAIAQKIVQSHHGHIEASSQVDKGSRFLVFMKALETTSNNQQNPDA